ncbi:site-specific integrase [Variovorax sp. LjRoot178]|uniref:site-specific integrase n=1 Tax=Variovorax sp. LjRoot178 TaxID=3342277 RepID=UPI003F51A6B2
MLPESLPAVLSVHPVLDPARLSRLTEKSARELVRQGQSANTRASYQGAMRYWAAWFAARYGQELKLPVPVPVVVQFIVDHAEREQIVEDAEAKAPASNKTSKKAAKKKAPLVFDLPPEVDQVLVAHGYKKKLGAYAQNTLVHRLAVLSKAHQNLNVDNPCNHTQVRELIKNVRSGNAKRGVKPHKQAALTKEPMDALLATCDDSPRGKRDRALLLFAWASGGRRRSEVADATMESLRKVDSRGYLYTLGHSKTNQDGKANPDDAKPVSGKAAAAMDAWLEASGITEGPIFRRILKGGKVLDEALDPTAVRKIVKRRCIQAGLPGDFSAHSLRSGFVTEAGRRKMDPADAMAMTGHRHYETFMGYYRAEDPLDRKASRMLDDDDTAAA